VMLRQKRAEKGRRRRRHRDGGFDLTTDVDDQIKSLVDAMTEAANEDRNSNTDRRPAIQKRKMLPQVKAMLVRTDLIEPMAENGMIGAISEWLAPLPDKSLPALEVRSTLLNILGSSYLHLEQGTLKQSGLGKAVMFLFKHPKETKENKSMAAKLIREWSRPIFQLDSSISKEDRLTRDYNHMPSAKRARLSISDEGLPVNSNTPSGSRNRESIDEEGLRPGDFGFINRARVPKPSTKDYVIRPKHQVEGKFHESKGRSASRFAKVQREFSERNRNKGAKRAVGVSISGAKMDI